MEKVSSSQVNSDEVVFWLAKAEEWTSDEKKQDLSTHMKDLKEFLHRLGTWLYSQESVTTALQHQPKLGRLLGRLCSSQHLLSHEAEVYSTLLTCVQALRTERPQDGMERKAKNWAESQIRHTVSFYSQSNPVEDVGESVGFTASEYNTLATDQLILSIQQDLEDLLQQQKQLLTRLDSGSNLLSEVSGLCIPLLSNASSKRLVECLILLNEGSCDRDQLSELFLDRVTELQACAHSPDWGEGSSVWSLDYEALVSLWLQHLPALEQEILLLLGAYTDCLHHHGKGEALNAISSRKLPRACAEHTVLYKAVDSCLQQVLWETKGNHHVIRFMHLFQVAVQEAVLQTTSPQVNTVHSFFPQRLQPLVNLLAVDPKVLPKKAQAIHLVSIYSTLKNTLADAVIANNPREMFTLWTVFIKFQSWYYAATSMLVRGGCHLHRDTGVQSACLGLVSWFSWPLSHAMKNNAKESIQDIAETLHNCMAGSVFEAAELKRALSPYADSSPGSKRDDTVITICTALVMSALFLSSCMLSSHVMDTLDLLLNLAGAPGSSYNKLVFLLDYTDLLQPALPGEVSAVGLESGVPSHVREAIQSLMKTVENDVAEGRMNTNVLPGVTVLHKRCNDLAN